MKTVYYTLFTKGKFMSFLTPLMYGDYHTMSKSCMRSREDSIIRVDVESSELYRGLYK